MLFEVRNKQNEKNPNAKNFLHCTSLGPLSISFNIILPTHSVSLWTQCAFFPTFFQRASSCLKQVHCLWFVVGLKSGSGWGT